MDEEDFDIRGFVTGMWRHRRTGIVVAWCAALLGCIVLATQKDVYEASARVYVDTSSQLRLLLDDQIVDSNVDDQLRFVREALLGRPQLERVARETGLLGEGQTPDEVFAQVESLRAQMDIVSVSEAEWRRRRNSVQTDDTYIIRYAHTSRTTAITVVDKLLNIIVEDTVGAKQLNSEEAAQFISGQLEDYRNRLQAAESALAEFNRRNFDRLPSLQGDYFQNLQAARAEVEETELELELAKSRLESIEAQIGGVSDSFISGDQLDPYSLEARIIEAERELTSLKLRYTDQHPDVIGATELLRRLQSQDRERLSTAGVGGPSVSNPVSQALAISRNEVLAEIASLSASLRQRNRRVDELQGLIGEMPEVEAERARLNRDYDIIQERYQSLSNSLEREKLSRNVVASEEFEFRVIDPPSASLEPITPNRMLLHLLVFVGSLGLGAGAAFLRTSVTPVFDSTQSLSRALDLPVIGAVSSGSLVGQESIQKSAVKMLLLAAMLCGLVLGASTIGPNI